jgi:hypothetical protein
MQPYDDPFFKQQCYAVFAALQYDVARWINQVFGSDWLTSKEERGCRVLEEALELAQAMGVTHLQAVDLARQVYNKPTGEVPQELGGVMHTLLACHAAYNINAANTILPTLEDVWQRERMEKIRKNRHNKIGATNLRPFVEMPDV